MSTQNVYVPLTGPLSIQALSAAQQSAIITYVNAVVHTGESNISFEIRNGMVNIKIVPTPSISADYIANTYINYAPSKPGFDQNIIARAPGIITAVGMAVIVTPPVMSELVFKTEVPNVSPNSLTMNLDLSSKTYGDLKKIIINWTNIKEEDLIIGTTERGPINEGNRLTDDTLLIDCKIYNNDGSTTPYFTAAGAQIAVLDNNPIPPQPTKIPDEYKVCLYYSSWGIYERNFYLPAIDLSRVTHLIYAFADIAPDSQHPEPNGKTLENGTVYMPDINDVRVGFDALKDIRKKYPHLKTILSVGGWTYSVNFSAMANDPAQRARFVESAAALMSNNDFDGIDIDWEIPVEGGNGIQHSPADKQNFTTLLQEIRDKIGTDKLLTIAGPARPRFHNNLEVEKIAGIVDWVNLMAYDYHGPWMSATATEAEKVNDENSVTNYNAPLYPDYTAPIPKGKTHDLNIDASVRSLLTLNLPPEKLVLGLSFYGRAFSAVEPGPNKDGLYQSYNGHPHGTWPDEKGQASGVYEFWDLHDNYIGKPGWQDFYNHQAGAAWIYNADKKVFIGYDNEQTIWNKCAYLASHKLGGAMMWEACNDRYNQLLYVVSNALNEGGIKSTGQLVPATPMSSSAPKSVAAPALKSAAPPAPKSTPAKVANMSDQSKKIVATRTVSTKKTSSKTDVDIQIGDQEVEIEHTTISISQTIDTETIKRTSINEAPALGETCKDDKIKATAPTITAPPPSAPAPLMGAPSPTPMSSEPVAWDDIDQSQNGTVRLTKITVAKSATGIIGIKTTYGDVDSPWRGSAEGIRTELNVPADRFIDRMDFYLGDGTHEVFTGLGFNIDNRTYVALGDTTDVKNMISIGSESSRLTHLNGTLVNGEIAQLTGDFNHSPKSTVQAFNALETYDDIQFKGTAYEYEMGGGFAYAGQIKGDITPGGIEAHLNIAGIDTPHTSIVVGSMDFASQMSLDGGFSYKLGMQIKTVNGSFKIGNPNDPAITAEYFGPTLGFMNDVGYQNGNLKIVVSNPLGKADFEAGTEGITCDCTLITGFSEKFEIDSSHIKIGFDGNGIEINSQRIGVFFGIGPFSIHVTLIDFHAILMAIEDFINIGKAIWDFSFKVYMAYKNFVLGVFNVVHNIMKFLFG